MLIEKLSFKHKEQLYPKLKKINSMISDYSFANLFLFRKKHNYEILYDGDFYIRGETYDGKIYIMPVIPFNEIDLSKVEKLLKEADFIFPIDIQDLSDNSDNSDNSDRYKIDFNLNDSDYIYTVLKMKDFKGRNLHGKRNLLHQFEKNFNCEIKSISNENKKDAIFVVEKWQENAQSFYYETDFEANIEAIKYYEKLNLFGFIYYVSKMPVGIVIGEQLRSDTFALHFAKGLKNFKGIYQFMYNSFAKFLYPDYKFINFEQDLGISSLRQSKNSYEPDVLIHKLRLSLQKGIEPFDTKRASICEKN